MAKWWDGAAGKCSTSQADDHALTALLKEAAGAFGTVTGYTSAPKGPHKRWIKGHRALFRDMNTLGTMKSIVKAMMSQGNADVLQLPDTREAREAWKRMTKRITLPADRCLPRRMQLLPRARWGEILEWMSLELTA